MRYLNLCRNVTNWWDYLFFKFGMRKEDPLFFHCRNGVVATVPQRLLQSFKEVFFSECYTNKPFEKRLRGGNLTVLDIGANAGYFSLFMLSRYPDSRILAFEPVSKNFDLLERHRRLNAAKNFLAVNKAVGGESGKMVLIYDADDSFTTSASVFDRGMGSDTIEVPCVSLSDILRDCGGGIIDILKMDCEGSEYDILYHCPKPVFDSIRSIVLECHGGAGENETPQALRGFLASHGYTVRFNDSGIMRAWRDNG